MKTMTGVGGIICAAHTDANGRLHGHTWEVIAWWDGRPDAVSCQVKLNEVLSEFDHTRIDDEISWAEEFGSRIISILKCKRVEINRPLERIYAIIEGDQG